MWSERTLRRTGIAVALAAALAAAQPPGQRPATDRTVPLDAFTATAHTVTQLRESGASPVCRLRVAVWEPHRPDADRFPPRVLGEAIGLFGDRWLDIRAWDALAPVLSDRLRLCREKGFTAARLGDDWADPAGFALTAADWERFGGRVAVLAAEHGLALD